jgi:hypothetical protein
MKWCIEIKVGAIWKPLINPKTEKPVCCATKPYAATVARLLQPERYREAQVEKANPTGRDVTIRLVESDETVEVKI